MQTGTIQRRLARRATARSDVAGFIGINSLDEE
jgi:hypothetical protein